MRAGAPLAARDLQAIVDAIEELRRFLIVPTAGVRGFSDRYGTYVRGVAGAAASGLTSAAFGIITARSGTLPPYRYSAEQALPNVDGVWDTVTDGAQYYNLFLVEEQGSGGEWVNPLNVGDVVTVFAADEDGNLFVGTRCHYRGTY